ncbi:MAG: hypothetical protein U0163_17695 [Gemmatimonadaceae bacterium]
MTSQRADDASASRKHALLAWLLETDPSIRWQVMCDLAGATAPEVAAERARVASEGWGAQVLAQQRSDGTWSGVAWNHGWDSTMHALMLLRDFGLDPVSKAARQALDRVREQVTWKDCGPDETQGNAFFAGEIEPCINAQVCAVGAYFRQDVRSLVDRLLSEQLNDGGWNCQAEFGSTRSSFHTTICVLEALLEFEMSIGRDASLTAARARAHEYLLERRLLRRKSTGEVIRDRKGRGTDWTRLAFPTWWHYDILRGLDYLRLAGVAPDARLDEVVQVVRDKRSAFGAWPLDVQYPGTMPLDLGEREGQPSRWITLRALRVLNWFTPGT